MIKKIYSITILCTLISSALCAMDTPNNPIIKTIDIAKIKEIAFLGNDNLIFTHDNRKTRYVKIIELATNNITPLFDAYVSPTDSWHFVTDQDKTKAMVVNPYRLVIYDLQSKKKPEHLMFCHSARLQPHFSDIENSILMCNSEGEWVLRNYSTETDQKYPYLSTILKEIEGFQKIAYHPTTKQLAIATNANEIYRYRNIEESKFDIIKPESHISNLVQSTEPLYVSYSPDGSFLSYYSYCDMRDSHYFAINIININANICHSALNLGHRHAPIAFHPSSAFLAIFIPDQAKFLYHSTNTCKSIEQPLSNDYQTNMDNEENHIHSKISFSADGSLLAFALPNKGIVIQVPFEVIAQKAYPLGTKEKMIYLLWLLKNYQHNNENLFPDIARLLATTTLATLELPGS